MLLLESSLLLWLFALHVFTFKFILVTNDRQAGNCVDQSQLCLHLKNNTSSSFVAERNICWWRQPVTKIVIFSLVKTTLVHFSRKVMLSVFKSYVFDL